MDQMRSLQDGLQGEDQRLRVQEHGARLTPPLHAARRHCQWSAHDQGADALQARRPAMACRSWQLARIDDGLAKIGGLILSRHQLVSQRGGLVQRCQASQLAANT